MIKKITAIILTSAMLFCQTAFAWEPVSENNKDLEYGLLAALGIMDMTGDRGLKENYIITRGKLADTVMKMLGRYNTGAYADYFEDVTAETENAQSISALTTMGIISKNNKYYPDDAALYEHAVKMIVYLLGYGIEVENSANWPSNVLAAAARIGLLEGVDAKIGDELNAATLAKLVYNALDTDLMQSDYKGNLEIIEDKTLLSEKFEVYKKRGIITANSITSLTSASGVNDGIIIDDVIYMDYDNAAQEYLGMHTELYYTEDNGENEVVFAYPTSTNNVLSIKAKDLEPDDGDFSYTKICYVTEGTSGTKTAKIDSEADVIYNGKAYPSFTDDTFKIDTGSIKLIDNDNDRAADVVVIKEFENYVVETALAEKKQVYDVYGKYLNLEDAEHISITGMYGDKMDFNELVKWNVLSVEKSLDGEVANIVVYDDPVTGAVEEMTVEGDDTYVTIDGDKFAVSAGYLQAVKDGKVNAKEIFLSQSGTYYLDGDERIAAVKTDSSDSWLYGYAINVHFEQGTDENWIEIFRDSSGAKKYSMAETVIMDGAQKTGSKIREYMCIDENGQNTGNVIPQLVKFMFNSEGKVRQIDTAKTTSSENDQNLSKDVDKQSEYWSIRTGRVGIGDSVGVLLDPKKTMIIHVPTDDIYNDEKYSIRTKNYENNQFLKYDAYDVDFTGVPKAVVVYGEVDNGSNEYGTLLLVTAVMDSMNKDDEECKIIKGLNISGKEIELFVDSDVNADSISKGDLITYSLDYKDEIEEFQVQFDAQNDKNYTQTAKLFNSTGDYNPSYAANAQYYLSANIIADKQDSYIKTMIPGIDISTVSESSLTLSNTQTYDISDAVIYIYEDSGKRSLIRKLEPAELEEYVYTVNGAARAVVFTTYSQLRAVYIYTL